MGEANFFQLLAAKDSKPLCHAEELAVGPNSLIKGCQHRLFAAPTDVMQMTPLSDKLRCRSVDDVCRIFDQFGACIVPSAVAHCDLDALARFMCSGGDGLGWSSRGPGRFCVNKPGLQLTDHALYTPFTYSPVLALVWKLWCVPVCKDAWDRIRNGRGAKVGVMWCSRAQRVGSFYIQMIGAIS